ncbi:hypothetical protein SDC9_131941 [bioreactor metagenome]|uniref:Uncharacterized protein n=1 Tax=bioreactor metagenome TaxID=1076179 RepID=A0A645D6N7_9ZZZZ
MHDELEPHLAAHRRLTKDGADVEQADAAHFQQVLQKIGALALDGGLVDAVQIHRVIGHQAIATRDQFQAQLALAQAGFAGDQHAQPQNVHEHAVQRGARGEMLGQIGAHHVDHEGRRFVRGKQRNLRALAQRDQRVGRGLVIRQDQYRRLQRQNARHAALAVFFRTVGEVFDFPLSHDLGTKRVDVVEVADQIGARAGGEHGLFIEPARGSAQPGHPDQLQGAAKLFKQNVGTDKIRFHKFPD